MNNSKVTPLHPQHSTDVNFTIGSRLDGARNAVNHSMAGAPNFHHALIGTSGAGKTFTMRKMAIEFASQGVTQFILDTQGDYARQEFEANHDLKGVRVNEIRFGYGSHTAGLNPFVIQSNDHGGFHHAVLVVLKTIRLFNPAMGTRQKTLLRRLIVAAYQRKGITKEDPGSWSRTPPTMRDLLTVVTDEMKAAQMGIDGDVFESIDYWRRMAEKAQLKQDRERTESKRGAIQEEIDDAKEKLKARVFDLIEQEIHTPTKSANTSGLVSRLESIEDMIDGVVSSELFDGHHITPKRGAINVLDLTALNPADQQPIFYVLLERTFHSAIRTCRNLNPRVPELMFSFDEVKLFTALVDSPLDPINRFFTEGRKYGLGSLCGLQHAKQLTEEMRSSIGTILLMPVAKEKISDVRRLWGIPEEQMARLRPKSDALYAYGNNPFIPIKVFG